MQRTLWIDPKDRKPDVKHVVFERENLKFMESDMVIVRMIDQDGDEAHATAVLRRATETSLIDGKQRTDEYWELVNEGYQMRRNLGAIEPQRKVEAWMELPKQDAVDADWIIKMLDGDCDYCEHLTDLRDTSKCASCIHAPVGTVSFSQAYPPKNNWKLTEMYRPSIEERTIYPE